MKIKKGDWNKYQDARFHVQRYEEKAAAGHDFATSDIDHPFITTVEAEFDRAMAYGGYIDAKKFIIAFREAALELWGVDFSKNQEAVELKPWEVC